MREHFFIVGAQRSGTTYLYEILKQHPQICMSEPARPEPKYFMDKSINELNKTQYEDMYFSHCGNCKVFGEKSTSYYELENSAKLIASTYPYAKIIFFLRNPVKRALSNYYFSINNGFEKRHLNDVFLYHDDTLINKPNNVSVNPFNYLERGIYIKYIEIYKKYFSCHQIKVIIFEEFLGNINAIRNLYDFLGVDVTFTPKSLDAVINSSEKNIEVSDEVLDSIRNYFKEPNNKLETLLQREILMWR